MKKIATLIACLVPMLAAAQQQTEAPGPAEPAIANGSVPAPPGNADVSYLDFKAVLSDGKTSINLGEYPRASECMHRLELASTSPEFNQAIQQRPILYLTCVVLSKKA